MFPLRRRPACRPIYQWRNCGGAGGGIAPPFYNACFPHLWKMIHSTKRIVMTIRFYCPPHLGSVAPPKFKVCYATAIDLILHRRRGRQNGDSEPAAETLGFGPSPWEGLLLIQIGDNRLTELLDEVKGNLPLLCAY